jgi:hypothetical protein
MLSQPEHSLRWQPMGPDDPQDWRTGHFKKKVFADYHYVTLIQGEMAVRPVNYGFQTLIPISESTKAAKPRGTA